MKNDFQKLVDRELSGLCWNERMRQQVLHSLEKEEKPVKKKTAGMVLVLVLLLVGSLAMAAGMFSTRYHVLKKADETLYHAYGISDELLPFFCRELNETDNIVVYRGMEDLRKVTGDYTVVIERDKETVTWSLEGVAGAWNADKLTEINKICQKEDGYAVVVKMARADEDQYQLSALETSATKQLTEEEVLALMEKQRKEAEIAKQAAKLTVTEMDQIGRAAMKERFGLSAQQINMMMLENGSSTWYIKNDRKLYSLYYWLWQNENEWMEGNGIYIVDVNVETGAVEEIIYDNGLLGNG